MRTIITRWFMLALLLGWALSHATVFAQDKAKPTASEKLRANLDKAVTLDFTGNSLVEVLNHFRDKTGIDINVDQNVMMQMDPNFGLLPPGAGPMQQIRLKATNEKSSQVLRKLLAGQHLVYVVIDDAVLVTTDESGLMRQMRQRVNVDLEDVPFNKAVRNLAKNHGINLVIDPKVAKQAETAVSLQLDGTGIETTVRLLAELANLKAVRMGNVLFITTEEKAKKIRDEEAQQLDNPFAPPVMNVPMIRAASAGSAAAVQIPGRVAPAIPVQAIPDPRCPRRQSPGVHPVPLPPPPAGWRGAAGPGAVDIPPFARWQALRRKRHHFGTHFCTFLPDT